MSIAYSDGEAEEARILRLLKQAESVSSLSPIAFEQYRDWAVRYHLSPDRANLVRHLCFDSLRVMEIGAGMGGFSRYIAEHGERFFAVEGTEARFRCLQERLRDLSNWSGAVANFQDVSIENKHDVVCLCGVLEYSQLYITPPDDFAGTPFDWMLKQARKHLTEDGVLLVAIENQLGLKYWNGAPEDHTGLLFDGMTGYPAPPCGQTFSRKVLLNMLNAAGFSHIDEYYPFPDYKTPYAMISEHLIDTQPQIAAEIAASACDDPRGIPEVNLFSAPLTLRTITEAGLLKEFANSFLFLATRDRESSVWQKLVSLRHEAGAHAWKYSFKRREPVVTVFSHVQDQWRTTKQLLCPDGETTLSSSNQLRVQWVQCSEALIENAVPLRTTLTRLSAAGRGGPLLDLMKSFLQWVVKHHAVDSPANHLQGGVVDLIFTNAMHNGSEFVSFDQEWKLDSALPVSWLIMRNVLALERTAEPCRNSSFKTYAELYMLLCGELSVPPQLEADIQSEANFQELLTLQSKDDVIEILRSFLFQDLPSERYPRNPGREKALRQYAQSAYSPVLRGALKVEKLIHQNKLLRIPVALLRKIRNVVRTGPT